MKIPVYHKCSAYVYIAKINTQENNWANFGSDLPHLTIAGLLHIQSWSEQMICPNGPVISDPEVFTDIILM